MERVKNDSKRTSDSLILKNTKDSLSRLKKQKQLEDKQKKLEEKQKQDELNLRDDQIEHKNKQLWYLVVIIVTSILFAIFDFRIKRNSRN